MIGFHFSPGGNATGISQFFEQLEAAGVPVFVKSTDHYGIIQEALQEAPTMATCVYRLSTHGQQDGFDYDVPAYGMSPADAATRHWQRTLEKLPPEFDHDRVWVEPINEVDHERSDWLGHFAVALASQAVATRNRVTLFGWSSGEPEFGDWDFGGMQRYLRLCGENPEQLAIATHEYNLRRESWSQVYPWNIGRIQWLMDAADRLGVARPTIHITEYGWERNWVPAWEEARGQVANSLALYSRFPNVAGAAIWHLGGGGWGDIANQAQRLIAPLADFLVANYEPPIEERPRLDPAHFEDHRPGGETVADAAWRAAQALEVVRFNKTAALQRAAAADGRYLSGNEGRFTGPDGQRYAVQPFRDPQTDEMFGYYAPTSDYNDIRVATDPDDGGAPEPPSHLDVVPLSQRDRRWAYVTLGQDTGHGETIGSWGCLLVAYAMQAQQLGIEAITPPDLNTRMVQAGAFRDQYIQPAALRTAYPARVVYDGYMRRDNPAMAPTIEQWLADGYSVPAQVDFRPETATRDDQHWCLVIGGTADNWIVADPWTGAIGPLGDVYGIPGEDVLQAVFYRPQAAPPPAETVDLAPYLVGTGAAFGLLYEVQNNWAGGQERMQVQVEGDVVYHTKNTQWEQLRVGEAYIWRDVDTSPGDGRFYRLVDEGRQRWSRWAPRRMQIGEIFLRNPVVRFYDKVTCWQLSEYRDATYLRLVAVHERYEFFTGVSLPDVVELAWQKTPDGPWLEKYYYATGFGLAGWRAADGRASAISEIHAAGARPNNDRERIGCLE